MNRFLAHTGARFPIVQAPMGWIARSTLASAVSRAGGLGIIETSSGETENCQREIRTMVERGLPFGVNLPIRFLKDDAMLRFVCESGIRFVTTSAGSPAKFIAPLKAAGIVVYHAVPTLDAALKCVDAGVDGLVVEGGEGGGFKNPEEVSTLVLLQAIREKVDVPLIAAGGIVDGRGMAAAFALGAEAIQMGTRFVASAESPVHGNYKQAIVDAASCPVCDLGVIVEAPVLVEVGHNEGVLADPPCERVYLEGAQQAGAALPLEDILSVQADEEIVAGASTENVVAARG
jgi:enoyl-[acyl-carrier protein] reductase II